jgi:hypothetical protein
MWELPLPRFDKKNGMRNDGSKRKSEWGQQHEDLRQWQPPHDDLRRARFKQLLDDARARASGLM